MRLLKSIWRTPMRLWDKKRSTTSSISLDLRNAQLSKRPEAACDTCTRGCTTRRSSGTSSSKTGRRLRRPGRRAKTPSASGAMRAKPPKDRRSSTSSVRRASRSSTARSTASARTGATATKLSAKSCRRKPRSDKPD